MTGNRLKTAPFLILAGIGLMTSLSQADEAAAPAAAPAAAAPAAADAPAASEAPAAVGDTAAAPAEAKPKPRPAEMALHATTNPLLKVIYTGKRYISVGARGHILLSADGKNWKQVASPVDVLLTSVYFADADHGWIVGHDATILGTTDGGETWTLQNFQPELNKPLFDVLFLDANHGFAIGAYGLLLTTTDGGKQWSPLEGTALTKDEKHLNAIARLGDGSLIVVGEAGTIGVSSDQGQTWTIVKSPYESSLFSVLAAGDKGALIAGLRGNSFWSRDVRAGDWTRIDTKTDQSLFGMAALPGEQIAMVGLNATMLVLDKSGTARQIEIKDKDGNKQTDSLSWVAAADGGNVIVVGDGGVQRLATGQP